MKTGFLIPDYDEKMIEFAGKAGFDCMELFTLKGGKFDLDHADDDTFKAIREVYEKNNVEIATFACSLNHLDGDKSKRKENNEYFVKAIKACKKLGTDILCTNAWGNKNLTPAENIKEYKEVFGEFARIAESEGVKIAIENCPHTVGYPIYIGNIAHSPEMWEALFDAVPSEAIGLEFDPSHLFWQGINDERAIREFGDRIYSFHAKDTEINRDVMDRCGVYGKMFEKVSEWDFGSFRYRIRDGEISTGKISSVH